MQKLWNGSKNDISDDTINKLNTIIEDNKEIISKLKDDITGYVDKINKMKDEGNQIKETLRISLQQSEDLQTT